jgi:anti-sigma regulatory factor (Ser/Thr protein kinase)
MGERGGGRVRSSVRPADGDHVVRFYEDDDDLCSRVLDWLLPALTEGAGAILIATDEHRRLFSHALTAGGLDAHGAVDDGRLVLLDAAETLSTFMVDGTVDPLAFDARVGDVVRAAAARKRPVHAFGEMVALLWQAGNVTGALELEERWNDLVATVPFSLMCAYPAAVVSHAVRSGEFALLCDEHTQVVGTAPTEPSADASRRFAGSVHDPRLARQFVLDALWGRVPLEVLQDSLLVVSELAMNAVDHAHGDFTVSVLLADDMVRIVVGDTSTEPPGIRRTDVSREHGRGLRLVDQVASEWGHLGADGGKLVWAHLRAPAR